MCLSGTFHALHHEPDAAPARPDQPVGPYSRRCALVGAAVAAATVAMPAAPAQAAPRRHGAVRDLAHVFRVDFPSYAGDQPGRRTVTTIEDTGFYVQSWSFAEHVGTHLDAPGHVVPGGRLVPELDGDVGSLRDRCSVVPPDDADVDVRGLHRSLGHGRGRFVLGLEVLHVGHGVAGTADGVHRRRHGSPLASEAGPPPFRDPPGSEHARGTP